MEKIQAEKITYLGITWYKVSKSKLRSVVEMVPELNNIETIKKYLYYGNSEDIYLNSADIKNATKIWKNKKR